MSAPFSAFDHVCMSEALRLAARGGYTTRPNPQVGCVLARGGEVVGRGWHRQAGGAHAEVFALREAGGQAQGATAYVTLEPCAHHGRTPPCADALIAAGVARVVVAQRDPFGEVDGRGIARLRAAGIEVTVGLLESEAREQIRGFRSRIERGRPWLRLKLAMSLDGRTAMASGDSKWISGAAARADVQRWRARSDAILVGAGTLRADDPTLTARVTADLVAPLRVVLAGRTALPTDRQLFRDAAAPVLVLHPRSQPVGVADDIEQQAVDDSAGRVDLGAALRILAQRQIGELQVECGAALAGALLRGGWVDELLLYQAPVLLGDQGLPLFAGLDIARMQQRHRLSLIEVRRFGDDQRLLLRPDPALPHTTPEDTRR